MLAVKTEERVKLGTSRLKPQTHKTVMKPHSFSLVSLKQYEIVLTIDGAA